MSDIAHPQTITTAWRGRVAALVAIIALGVLAAACGSDSGDGTTPSIDRSDRSSTLPPTTTEPTANEEAATTTSGPGIARPSTTTTPDVPTTAAPTSAAPTTAAPRSTAPRSTTPRTTAAPTTASTTTTAPTTTSTTTTVDTTPTTAISTGQPAEGDSSSNPWWPWALAAAVLVGGVAIVWSRSRRRAALLATKTGDLLDQMAEVAGELAALDAAALNRLARSSADRLATLGAGLTTTASATKDPGVAESLTRLRQDASALHQSVDAVALAPTPPTAQVMESVHQQAAHLHALIEQTRASSFPTPRGQAMARR